MTYMVTENRIRCKYMDCVEVCPVDCFYAGNRQTQPTDPGAENLTEQISVNLVSKHVLKRAFEKL